AFHDLHHLLEALRQDQRQEGKTGASCEAEETRRLILPRHEVEVVQSVTRRALRPCRESRSTDFPDLSAVFGLLAESEIDDKPPGSFRKKSARGCMFMGNKQ